MTMHEHVETFGLLVSDLHNSSPFFILAVDLAKLAKDIFWELLLHRSFYIEGLPPFKGRYEHISRIMDA